MYSTELPTHEYWKRQIKCQDACPVHTDARGYVRAIAAGDYEEAYLIARGPNPLAGICGRVCGAPCEANCRRGDIDGPISIRALKRFAAESFHTEMTSAQTRVLRALRARTDRLDCADVDEFGPREKALEQAGSLPGAGQSIGIVGSGPAGLAAAHDLALFGFKSIIYEREPVPAGMLCLGVPPYRLPREIITAEVGFIELLGVEILTGVEIGRDATLEELFERHDAVIVAVGARKSRFLPLKGVEGGGVMGGIEFLRDVNLGNPVTLGEEIVVIGGGNVAYDVARSTIRHLEGDVARSAVRMPGVHKVHLCCLESREEMPADDIEIEEGSEEGIELHTRVGPDEVLRDENGTVTGLKLRRVLSVFDDEGRFAPVFEPHGYEEIRADTVLFAIGQAFDLDFLEAEKNGIELTRNGLPKVGEDLRTSRKGLYVAGDAAHGPSLMIHAIASGKRAARAICEALSGRRLPSGSERLHTVIHSYARETGYEARPRQPVPTTDAESRRGSHCAVVERGYGEQSALCEAGRCLDCGVNTIFDGNLCILCGGCADVCPELCLRLVGVEELAADPDLAAVMAAVERVGGAPRSAIIKDETRCIRCACCAHRCPVGAITMERFTFKEAIS